MGYKENYTEVTLPTNISQFGEIVTAEKDRVVEVKSIYGISAIRDITTENGSATVTNDGTVYKVTTTASGSDNAKLESAEIARYIPGSTGELGVGIRTDTTPTGSQELRWGYYDADNGFGFGIDSTGKYVFRRKDGTDTKFHQANSEWNVSPFHDLDYSNGAICQIDFTWYGYGIIEYSIYEVDNDGSQQTRTIIHRERVTGETSVANPNQPITVEVDNDGEAAAGEIEVGGRQYSVIGRYNPNRRVNGEIAEGVSASSTIVPLVTLRRKSSFQTVSVKVEGLDIITNNSILVEIRTNTSGLTNSSFGTPSNTTAAETAVEADTSATAVSGGEILWRGIFAGGSGNKQGISRVDTINFDFIRTNNVSVVARKLSGENDASVDCVFRVREEW